MRPAYCPHFATAQSHLAVVAALCDDDSAGGWVSPPSARASNRQPLCAARCDLRSRHYPVAAFRRVLREVVGKLVFGHVAVGVSWRRNPR